MRGFLNNIRVIVRIFNIIAGIALIFMMFLTVCDIVLRFLRMPIVGTYELVAFSGAIVIGFSLPFTSWIKGHVNTDFFILLFPKQKRNIFHVVTRCLGIILFFLTGWNLLLYGRDLYKSGEVSLTLQMPFYPVAYGIGICCFIECLVLFCDILKIIGGKDE
jgi:TRAP-type C4-dicarboxylate transport system permease small subunit